MSKEIALFDVRDVDRLLIALEANGWTFANPRTAAITGWASNGDNVILDSQASAIKFLLRGNGIQLWKNESEDLLLSFIQDKIRLYFDGFSISESQLLMFELRIRGLSFQIDYDY